MTDPLPIGTRVLIDRHGHPWFGHSGVVVEHVTGNPYIDHAVALDVGMKAGCKRLDMRDLTEAKPRRKRP